MTMAVRVVLAGLFAGLVGAAACGHSEQIRAVVPPGVAPLQADASGIPVALSPRALLAPGGARSLQSRLVAEGHLARNASSGRFDGATREALSQFQHAAGLPETGLPSYETVSRLGLEPDRIFETAPAPQETLPPEASPPRSARSQP